MHRNLRLDTCTLAMRAPIAVQRVLGDLRLNAGGNVFGVSGARRGAPLQLACASGSSRSRDADCGWSSYGRESGGRLHA